MIFVPGKLIVKRASWDRNRSNRSLIVTPMWLCVLWLIWNLKFVQSTSDYRFVRINESSVFKCSWFKKSVQSTHFLWFGVAASYSLAPFHLAFPSTILLSLSSLCDPLFLFFSLSSSTSRSLSLLSLLHSSVDRSLKGACLATFNNERTQNYLSTRRERMVLPVFSDCVWPDLCPASVFTPVIRSLDPFFPDFKWIHNGQ